MKNTSSLELLLRKLRSTPDVAATLGPVHGRALKPEPGRGLDAIFKPGKVGAWVPVKRPRGILALLTPEGYRPPFRPALAPEDRR